MVHARFSGLFIHCFKSVAEKPSEFCALCIQFALPCLRRNGHNELCPFIASVSVKAEIKTQSARKESDLVMFLRCGKRDWGWGSRWRLTLCQNRWFHYFPAVTVNGGLQRAYFLAFVLNIGATEYSYVLALWVRNEPGLIEIQLECVFGG